MARSGFWNKKRVSEAKHYPTGVRRYCDKHGVTFESYQNYCFRHSISSASKVTDGRGNNMWTFELFQQALKAPSASSFCKQHNLSYSMFYHYKKFGFPGQQVKKGELNGMHELATNIVDDTIELTDEDVVGIFDSTEVVPKFASDIDVESVDQSDSARNDVVVSEVTKHRVPKGFWTLDRIEEAKNYPNGFENFFKDNNVSVGGYKSACRRFGLSSAIPTRKRTRTNCGRKDHFWSLERIEEAKLYPGGIKQFCADNGTTEKAYQMACYVRGVDFHVDPNEARTKNLNGFWSLERIEEAKSYPGGVKAFCDKYHISVSTYRSVCSRFEVSSKADTSITTSKLAESPGVVEPVTDLKPYLSVNVFDKIRCSVVIKFKDGRVKELRAPEVGSACFVLPSNMEIDTVEFKGNGSISFI